MKKKIYMFRHGQTQMNFEGIVQGQISDLPIPLNKTGERQAKILAEELKDKGIELILSSDLLRAKQTAEFVAEINGVKIEFDKRLRETNYGLLDGNYTNDLEELFPGYKRSYDDHSIPFPGGESLIQVRERFETVLKEVCKVREEDIIAVSSHGNCIRTFYSYVVAEPYESMENCEYLVIEYNEKNDKFVKSY